MNAVAYELSLTNGFPVPARRRAGAVDPAGVGPRHGELPLGRDVVAFPAD